MTIYLDSCFYSNFHYGAICSELFDHLGPRWITGGDYNTKYHAWGSRIITTKGKALHTAATCYNVLPVSNGLPTYWSTDPEKKPDCIDFFSLKGLAPNYVELNNISDLSSDHSPLILTLSNCIIHKSPCKHITSKRTDRDSFRKNAHKCIDLHTKLKSEAGIDAAVNMFPSILLEEAKIATPILDTRKPTTSNPKKVMIAICKCRRALCGKPLVTPSRKLHSTSSARQGNQAVNTKN